MKKILYILSISLFLISCSQDEEIGKAYIKGTIVCNSPVAFKVQLIPGEIENLLQFDSDYTWPDAQVFFTQNDGEFQFDELDAGHYTLQVSKPNHRWLTMNGHSSHYLELKIGEVKDVSINMLKDLENGKIQIFDEDGQAASKISFPVGTLSVHFFLFNNKDKKVQWDTHHSCFIYSNEWRLDNGQWVQDYSHWIKSISPSSGTLEPYEIVLVTVILDPLIYSIEKNHSSCEIEIYDYTNYGYPQILALEY